MPRSLAGALRQWRIELRTGARSKLDLDPLWRAACLEIEGEEAEQDGLLERAGFCRVLAAAVIVASARRSGAVTP
jgi:hypothetical protein